MDSIFLVLRSTHYFSMVVLISFIAFTIGKFALKKSANKPFDSMDEKATLVVMILSHIQLLFGIFLLFGGRMSHYFSDMGAAMKDSYIRMMVVEHPLTMIIGVVLITIGRIRLKKMTSSDAKYKNILVFFTIALILFLIRIPWNHLNG